jgi:hypothetical protein
MSQIPKQYAQKKHTQTFPDLLEQAENSIINSFSQARKYYLVFSGLANLTGSPSPITSLIFSLDLLDYISLMFVRSLIKVLQGIFRIILDISCDWGDLSNECPCFKFLTFDRLPAGL